MVTTADARTIPLTHPANDRLKAAFRTQLALAFLAATLIHLAVFELWPTMQAPVWASTGDIVDIVQLDDIVLPAAPEPLPRPLAPVAAANVVPDATIDIVPFARDRVELPPPRDPTRSTTDRGAPAFVPYDVGPRIVNRADAVRALERAYPPILRDAGIEGTVLLEIHLGTAGELLEAKVGTSSGIAALDAAALRAIEAFRFSPALNRDTPTAVWVRFPVKFEINREPIPL